MDVAVVGIGRTAYARPRKTERSTLALAAEAARAAIADAGLAPADVDGLACFGVSDTSLHSQVSFAIGIDEVAWNLDVNGGGDTVCATVQAAAAAIVTGQCKVAVVFRSLNGRSGVRFGQGEGVASTLSHFEPSLDRPTGLAVPHQWMALVAQLRGTQSQTVSVGSRVELTVGDGPMGPIPVCTQSSWVPLIAHRPDPS